MFAHAHSRPRSHTIHRTATDPWGFVPDISRSELMWGLRISSVPCCSNGRGARSANKRLMGSITKPLGSESYVRAYLGSRGGLERVLGRGYRENLVSTASAHTGHARSRVAAALQRKRGQGWRIKFSWSRSNACAGTLWNLSGCIVRLNIGTGRPCFRVWTLSPGIRSLALDFRA